MPASAILLLDANPIAAEPIAASLTRVGYSVTPLTDADEAFGRATEFALIIIDEVRADRSAVEICREVRATPSLSAIPVLCICQSDDVEERVRFLEAGADDVMTKPFDARELEARVEALLVRFKRSRDLAPMTAGDVGGPVRRHLVACFSPKGGVGTTTIAVNVATWLGSRHPERVLAVDLDGGFGQVATHLNLKPRHTIAELARDDQALREAELLRSYAERHESGLHVLAAPSSPEAGRLLTAEQADLLLTTARTAYDTIIVDAGSDLTERTMAVLEWAEGVVLPVVPEIGALKALHSLLEYLTEVGSVRAKSIFALNHIFAREMLTMKQIESSIAAKVEVELPYDPGLYLKAVNEGIPLVRGAARSAPAERLGRLAAAVTGDDLASGNGGKGERRLGLLGGRSRRT